MASKSLWAIVDYLRENETITPRQVQILLGCDCKKSHNLLLHLVRRAVVKRGGESHRPVYTLLPGEKPNIKRLKETEVKNAVAAVCRQNWQGYRIHKIFGSERA